MTSRNLLLRLGRLEAYLMPDAEKKTVVLHCRRSVRMEPRVRDHSLLFPSSRSPRNGATRGAGNAIEIATDDGCYRSTFGSPHSKLVSDAESRRPGLVYPCQ